MWYLINVKWNVKGDLTRVKYVWYIWEICSDFLETEQMHVRNNFHSSLCHCCLLLGNQPELEICTSSFLWALTTTNPSPYENTAFCHTSLTWYRVPSGIYKNLMLFELCPCRELFNWFSKLNISAKYAVEFNSSPWSKFSSSIFPFSVKKTLQSLVQVIYIFQHFD